jgi:hypothetical protein
MFLHAMSVRSLHVKPSFNILRNYASLKDLNSTTSLHSVVIYLLSTFLFPPIKRGGHYSPLITVILVIQIVFPSVEASQT